jgi:hypothetical protein
MSTGAITTPSRSRFEFMLAFADSRYADYGDYGSSTLVADSDFGVRGTTRGSSSR